MNILKTFFTIIIICCVLVFSSLYYLSVSPIKIQSDKAQNILKFFNKDLRLEEGDVTLTSVNFKLKLFSNELVLATDKKAVIKLKNLEFLWNVFFFSGRLNGNIEESDLLKLVTSEDINIQEQINNFNKRHYIPLNGQFSAKFRFFSLLDAKLDLSNVKGKFNPAELAPLNLDNIKLSLYLKNNMLSIKELLIQYEKDLKIELHGDFQLKHYQVATAKFTASIKKLPISYLSSMWPEFVFPEVHQWIKDHITEGIINSAEGVFNFTEEDLKENSKIAKDAISTKIEVVDAKINYDDQFSPIHNVEGIVSIDGESLQVKAKRASFIKNEINNFELVLPFDNLLLSIKANIEGKIADFKEFVPIEVQDKLKNYGINYNSIQGKINGSMEFKLPIDKDFDVKNMHLQVKGELAEIVFDKFALIRIKKANIEIVNEAEKIQLKISNDKNTLFYIIHHHDEAKAINNIINFDILFNISNKLTIKNIILNAGTIKVKAQISEQEWSSDIDLTNAEIILMPLAFVKNSGMKASLSCQGKLEESEIIGDECKLAGQDFQGNLSFAFLKKDSSLKSISLENVKLGANIFTFSYKADGSFSSSYIKAKNLDLSNFIFSKEAHSNYYFSYSMDNVILKNGIILTEMKGYVSKPTSTSFLDLSMNAKVDNDKIVISKAIKNNKTFYSFYSSSAASFFKAFNIYKNIKKGELSAEIYPENNNNEIYYSGNIEVKKFYLSNTSILTKVILGILSPLNSPQAIAQSMQGGSLPADSFKTAFIFKDNRFTLNNGLMDGPSYQVKINGYADLNNETLKFKGVYIPSFYGVNTFISMIPLFGKLLAGGDKSAFIAANFEVNGSFSKPVTKFNPLSIFTPGFLRNFFN